MCLPCGQSKTRLASEISGLRTKRCGVSSGSKPAAALRERYGRTFSDSGRRRASEGVVPTVAAITPVARPVGRGQALGELDECVVFGHAAYCETVSSFRFSEF
jgi:hypothetical protein